MPTQFVMNHNGHDEHAFDKADVVSLDEAERRFNELGKSGIWVKPGIGGSPASIMRKFDPESDMRFQPHHQGG